VELVNAMARLQGKSLEKLASTKERVVLKVKVVDMRMTVEGCRKMVLKVKVVEMRMTVEGCRKMVLKVKVIEMRMTVEGCGKVIEIGMGKDMD